MTVPVKVDIFFNNKNFTALTSVNNDPVTATVAQGSFSFIQFDVLVIFTAGLCVVFYLLI